MRCLTAFCQLCVIRKTRLFLLNYATNVDKRYLCLSVTSGFFLFRLFEKKTLKKFWIKLMFKWNLSWFNIYRLSWKNDDGEMKIYDFLKLTYYEFIWPSKGSGKKQIVTFARIDVSHSIWSNSDCILFFYYVKGRQYQNSVVTYSPSASSIFSRDQPVGRSVNSDWFNTL